MLKEEEVLNQWLDKQLKAGLIVESKSKYVAPLLWQPPITMTNNCTRQ